MTAYIFPQKACQSQNGLRLCNITGGGIITGLRREMGVRRNPDQNIDR